MLELLGSGIQDSCMLFVKLMELWQVEDKNSSRLGNHDRKTLCKEDPFQPNFITLCSWNPLLVFVIILPSETEVYSYQAFNPVRTHKQSWRNYATLFAEAHRNACTSIFRSNSLLTKGRAKHTKCMYLWNQHNGMLFLYIYAAHVVVFFEKMGLMDKSADDLWVLSLALWVAS